MKGTRIFGICVLFMIPGMSHAMQFCKALVVSRARTVDHQSVPVPAPVAPVSFPFVRGSSHFTLSTGLQSASVLTTPSIVSRRPGISFDRLGDCFLKPRAQNPFHSSGLYDSSARSSFDIDSLTTRTRVDPFRDQHAPSVPIVTPLVEPKKQVHVGVQTSPELSRDQEIYEKVRKEIEAACARDFSTLGRLEIRPRLTHWIEPALRGRRYDEPKKPYDAPKEYTRALLPVSKRPVISYSSNPTSVGAKLPDGVEKRDANGQWVPCDGASVVPNGPVNDARRETLAECPKPALVDTGVSVDSAVGKKVVDAVPVVQKSNRTIKRAHAPVASRLGRTRKNMLCVLGVMCLPTICAYLVTRNRKKTIYTALGCSLVAGVVLLRNILAKNEHH